jgi:hypothetical protein
MVVTEIDSLLSGSDCPIPLFSDPMQPGLPSPADDYVDCTIDLNEHLKGSRNSCHPLPSSLSSLSLIAIRFTLRANRFSGLT